MMKLELEKRRGNGVILCRHCVNHSETKVSEKSVLCIVSDRLVSVATIAIDEDACAGFVDEVGVGPLHEDEEFGAEANEESDVNE